MSLTAESSILLRGLHTCHECGDRFVSATDWINHTTPRCKRIEARERNAREDEARRARKRKLEDALTVAVQDALDETFGIGYVRTLETVARVIEGIDEDRANAIFALAAEK